MHQPIIQQYIRFGILHNNRQLFPDSPHRHNQIASLNIRILIIDIRTQLLQLSHGNPRIPIRNRQFIDSDAEVSLDLLCLDLAVEDYLELVEFCYVEAEAVAGFAAGFEDDRPANHESAAVEVGFRDVVDYGECCWFHY